MSGMVDISKSLGYAIHALIYMGIKGDKKLVRASEVARECGLSVSYMMKILQALRRAGIVDSTIGVKGGYVLARPLSKITLYDVIVAIEPARDEICYLSTAIGCRFKKNCLVRNLFGEVNEKVKISLKSVNLQAVVDSIGDKICIFFPHKI
ncbi:transcriptional regulator, BadM/Rrf2 family [Candidatus Kryptonium thompsonii]|uniref:Transcriptional regulator, BadM/Rrf2 family n=2 Tax=Candidatus Kryptonium thompsonii TaxID=1633631 RepID=A0A0P1MFA7_9BACT|nr:Rrf2 family transcriptional regulator [Candidatus Kryptonium thompsoni]CUS81770.1 transcriptional regulator, BadM/Rrf2 family [Candidatus Kryptonium thompsoni]CUS82328.1 transcriptional regulator, BadM/Rrf2 family [Candidatus Kryptonium thompsoni]CUS87773.1 transcriptional regulator, BadM/Rrf2 family [Candidatus Kryptonium thompsoni]CUS93999.1 transcriptional regulator, BadM/Rrf2 family [Candidatus Kryptonium thompsoni]CUS94308.1 transcriptional regulator, BadM/Rrf2 family [Candidatus Krypt